MNIDPHQVVKKCKEAKLSSSDKMLRINKGKHSSAIYYGRKALYRWDAKDNSYGVMYTAKDIDTAFAETFGHDVINQKDFAEDKFIGLADLMSHNIWELKANKPLRLLDLTGESLIRLNLDTSFVSDSDYELAQCISAIAYESGYDGIYYQSRAHPRGLAYALFDRTEAALEEACYGALADWSDEFNGRTIDNVLKDQGWYLYDANHDV
ncbi:RES family NAD+ phosphorylase [Thiolapillus sp.]|uniref:RES family NAD+ phosphorylase n=1 Tax=Thiolapillus sp. TaxID=2017437 RepID=UPI003AF8CB7C